jgi:SSS family solute:Na+ symporter
MTNRIWVYRLFSFTASAVLILGVGLWVSREKDGHQKRGRLFSLVNHCPRAIGSSLIAANISAEQFIGMSGLVLH